MQGLTIIEIPPGIFLPEKAVHALFACDPDFDLKHSAVLPCGYLLLPASIACVHPLPQFLLPCVFVVVFLDGTCTFSGHLGHMENGRSGIQFAGDKGATGRVPCHFFVDSQYSTYFVQRFTDL